MTVTGSSSLVLVPLGVGNSFPTTHYSTALALVSGDGNWLLIDCPHPIAKMAAEAEARSGIRLDFEKLQGVVVTHIHGDHVSGLESLMFYFRYTLGRKLSIAAHRDVIDSLWAGHLAAALAHPIEPWWDDADLDAPGASRPGHPCSDNAMADYCDVTVLDESAAVAFAGFDVECRVTRHVVPTTAVRVRPLLGGPVFAYSADTAFERALIVWLSAADRFAHDCGSGIHASYESLAVLPDVVRRRMWLAHYPDGLAAELEGVEDPIELLEEGQAYEIPVPSVAGARLSDFGRAPHLS